MLVKGKTFEIHPAGQYRGVCVDVVDMGEVEREYEGKVTMQKRLRIVFETDAELDNGETATVAFFASQTISKNSNLGKALKTWLGRDLTSEEVREGFDLESMIGQPAWLMISHSEDDKYANIDVLARMPKGLDPLEPTGDYVRVQDRDDAPSKPTPPSARKTKPTSRAKPRPVADTLPDPDDDDLPF